MRWQKLGRIFECRGIHPRLASHAANPLAIRLQDDIYRIYYGARDEFNRTSVGAVDIDIEQRRIVEVHRRPFFQFGSKGSFYSHGVSIGSDYTVGGEHYILFMGWHIPHGGHWRGEIGRLRLGPEFEIVADPQAPLIALAGDDPISLSYPWVVSTNSGYTMWYGSTVTWDAGNGEMLHILKQARSSDGIVWRRTGRAIPYELNRAQAFSRPTVHVASGGNQEMWFSYRSGAGESYRIGYARSEDGEDWELDLESAGIDVSDAGWDSEMIEYPFVFVHKQRQYMLYNGNGYGLTGFGLAVREE